MADKNSCDTSCAGGCGCGQPDQKTGGRKKLAELKKERFLRQAVTGGIFLPFIGLAWLFPVLGYFIPACMVLGLGIATYAKGRKWCDWLCFRGAFLDAVLSRFSPGREIPALLKTTWFRAAVLSFLMAMMTFQLVRLWPDPVAIGRFFVILLTVTTAAAVLLALVYHQRSWCYICPIGTLSAWATAKHSYTSIDSGSCIECGACGKVCPMQIKSYEFKAQGKEAVRAIDCLQCNLCVSACPKGSLEISR